MPLGRRRGALQPVDALKFCQRGLLASQQYANNAIFDDKDSERSEMRFDGIKGGIAWKSHMEMYLSGKCPSSWRS